MSFDLSERKTLYAQHGQVVVRRNNYPERCGREARHVPQEPFSQQGGWPQGNPLPTGRCYTIVAKKSNRPDAYLYEGPKGELPPKPEFMSAQETMVQYRTVDKGVLSFDLGGLPSEPSKGRRD